MVWVARVKSSMMCLQHRAHTECASVHLLVTLHMQVGGDVTGAHAGTHRHTDLSRAMYVRVDSTSQACCACLQVITGSHDGTVRLWDIRTGKTLQTLTYHKKSVRALAMSPNEVRRQLAGSPTPPAPGLDVPQLGQRRCT